MIWVGYTTRYRDGGAQMARAARTLAAERQRAHPELRVVCEAVESKAAFIAALQSDTLHELHLVAHSGMYGPMFGTTDWPEQLSPHEWRTLALDFAPGAQAWFLSCRSARWFAPFFANLFGVPTHGFHWYTSYSARPDRFAWEGPRSDPEAPLWVMGTPGRKSHGLPGSVLKYGLGRRELPKRFEPQRAGEGSYDPVAALYDQAFDDIRVRQDEWRWLEPRVPQGARVLDLGCGNGALLQQLAPRLRTGLGVDSSAGQLQMAETRCAAHPNLSFSRIEGPQLPLPDDSVDLAISLLSFRYLDWDPLMQELQRVLTPQGRLLVVDMAAAPLQSRELPRAAFDTLRSRWQRRAFPQAGQALRRLVGDDAWQQMLDHNPIRGEHEYRWYLESRFPGRKMELLNLGWHARVMAFDSGPFSQATLSPMAYP
ncbi:MAG: methyltransferase domain-containing protein [Myxococcota bacterium]|nr:methyltransferase domain-containing protein [Myxococcota bacterium]